MNTLALTLEISPGSLPKRLYSCCLFALLLGTAGASAANTKLTDLIGHPVVTDNGDRLGNVEDFAIDPETGSLQYVVISIGSFLVEKSLIAVQPGALAPAASGDPVVLLMEDLEVAHRFNADNWPEAADVRSVPTGSSSAGSSTGEGDGDGDGNTNEGRRSQALSGTGQATITAGSKSATYLDGKRELVNGPIRRSASEDSGASGADSQTPKAPRVVPNFKNLDRNRDGRLSRAEIGAELTQRSGFKDLDVDANGAIDDFEYAAYLERIAGERRWEGNR